MAFQIMLASADAGALVHDEMDDEWKDATRRRSDRLLQLAVDFLAEHHREVGSLYMTRMQYLTPDMRTELALARVQARKVMHGKRERQ